MTNGLKEKLLKLRTVFLDARCTPGERSNAESLYNRIMNKYGLEEADLPPGEEKEIVFFPYKNGFEELLIRQLVAKIIEPEKNNTYYRSRTKRKSKGYELTANQGEQAIQKYEALRKALAKELERCYRAFIQVNKLGLKPATESEDEISPDDMKEIDEVIRYMGIIRPTSISQTDKRRLLERSNP